MEYQSYPLTAGFESFQPKAYLDPGGKLTIGYGHTAAVAPGQECTQPEAEEWLRQDMTWAVAVVNHTLDGAGVKVSQGTFDALSDFVFNVGSRAFINSTFLRSIFKGDLESACASILLYCHDSKGEVLPGLVRRRRAEVKLIDPTYLVRHGLELEK